MNHHPESTASESDGPSSSGPDQVSLIRWVFPLPSPPAAWLERSRITIGRDADCNIRLASTQVSRTHAEITRSGPLWILSDLESKNGIFVNGKPAKSVALSSGDVVRIGDFVGVVMQVARGSDVSFGLLGSGIYGGLAHRLAMKQITELGPLDLPVVLEGDTGTGKERFARALHETSGRRGPFLAINCAVYSRSVASAELFGYRKGAFTGAEQASLGHVRAADGGTLLLDELIELPLDVQAMLLRVIEHREVLPLGETRPAPIDVRFVAATQVSLALAAERGRFRADLRARLEGTVVRLPSLRSCREIVPELFAALFEAHSGNAPALTVSMAERLCLHDWPLNVRELDTLVRRLMIAHRAGEKLTPKLLDASFGIAPRHGLEAAPLLEASPESSAIPGRRPADQPYDPSEVQALLAALARHGGNVTKASAEAGISRSKAYRMIEMARRSPPRH